MNSRDRLDQIPDSIDLTKSPVKHINTQEQMQKINDDTSDDDTDETITYDDYKAIYRKDTNDDKKELRL